MFSRQSFSLTGITYLPPLKINSHPLYNALLFYIQETKLCEFNYYTMLRGVKKIGGWGAQERMSILDLMLYGVLFPEYLVNVNKHFLNVTQNILKFYLK